MSGQTELCNAFFCESKPWRPHPVVRKFTSLRYDLCPGLGLGEHTETEPHTLRFGSSGSWTLKHPRRVERDEFPVTAKKEHSAPSVYIRIQIFSGEISRRGHYFLDFHYSVFKGSRYQIKKLGNSELQTYKQV